MKKGFTLIELLAVIVILAIIALIATPIILGIIEDARKGSIEASANGYIDAVEYQIARNEIKGEIVSDGTYDVHQLEIDLDGEKPDYGEVTIEKGKISKTTLCIDGKKVELKDNKPQVTGTCESLYIDSILNGADPVLKGELVPVNIASDGVVTKADVTKEWYNYTNKEWANAVILFDNKNYKVGDLIEESDIKEYYVWIPKYAYRLWNVNSNNTDNVEKPIEIVFGDKAKTTGTNNGDMYLHPAFTNFNTEGIWVGKFEVSYNEETFTDSATFLSVNPNSRVAIDSNEIIIKPNVRSLNSKNVSEFYTFLKGAHENLNSHVITNMEWGAAAYLTYSVYGRCDSNTCTEVTHNNVNTGYYGQTALFKGQLEWGVTITGCAADNIGDGPNSIRTLEGLNTYESEKGVLASTTGNITGIYDMSGGTYEYVMGVLGEANGKIYAGSGGFDGYLKQDDEYIFIEGTSLPNNKYYNIYLSNGDIRINYSSGQLGDATKEIANSHTDEDKISGLWFGDAAVFPLKDYPWINRGGSYESKNNEVGVLFLSYNLGKDFLYISSRAVLAF